MADVPDLTLDVVVTSIDTLSQAVVEATEVSTALAVDPAEVDDVVLANRPLDVREPEVGARQPAAALVELDVGGDVDDWNHTVTDENRAPSGRRPTARVLEEETSMARRVEQHPLPQAGNTLRRLRRTVRYGAAARRLIAP